jgi:hypothetical protein
VPREKAPRQAAPRQAARERTRRSPVWLLVGKELRLQQMSFVVAAMYVGFYLLVVLKGGPGVDHRDAVTIISAINIVVVSLVIGSIASAEERHLGTLDSQLLLPMSAARQWVVKVIFLVALTLLLAFVVPLVLVSLIPPGSTRYGWPLPAPSPSIVVALVCLTGSVYVSSLTSNALRALLTTLPAMLAVIIFTRSIGTPGQPPVATAASLDLATRAGLLGAVLSVMLVGLLWLALSNHRTRDRSWRRVLLQAGGIAGGLIVTVASAQALGLL